MNHKPGIIERAYQIAASGDVVDILHIKMQLNLEGYFEIDAHLDGSRLRGDLKRLIAAARQREKAPDSQASA